MKWEIVRLRRRTNDNEFATSEYFTEDGLKAQQVRFAPTVYDLGEDGWELVSVHFEEYTASYEYETMYFKRPRQ